jgi:hypothetical protein
MMREDDDAFCHDSMMREDDDAMMRRNICTRNS